MHRSFWEAVAPDWKAQIFETLVEDRSGAISEAIRGLAGQTKKVADFGCGVGHYLPLLSESFGEVVALDWATACVERTRTRARRLSNVGVFRSSPRVLAALNESCDVTVAVNVAIHPRVKARERALRQAVSLTKKGGWLVIVVPSLESVVYADAVRRVFRPRIRSEFGFSAGGTSGDPGVVALVGQPTKHYTAEEIVLLMRLMGCDQPKLRRVPYSWRIYRAGVPDRFAAADPWDWLLLARRATTEVISCGGQTRKRSASIP